MGKRMEVGQRVRLAAQGRVTPGGRFEVDAITAGEGNGWLFTERCLRESLPLWEGAACFVDHAGWMGGRSLRDLAGVFRNARWSAASRGVRLELQTLGPAGALAEALGQELLAEGAENSPEAAARPPVGFSADVLFTANGRNVQKIVRVFSLDLVFNPARGGAFVRALHSATQTGGERMENNELEQANLQSSQEAQEPEPLAAVCASLLEASLQAARLPGALSEQVRGRFAGRTFAPGELNGAIDQARRLLGELSGGAAVAGPAGRIQGVFNTEDQLQAAVDDLLGAPREKGAEGLKAARLSGVKELYMLLTGDRDLYGGYYGQRVQLATTATFPGLVKNAMNKIVASQWNELGRAGYDWWQRVTAQEHFDTLHQVTGVLVGTVGALPEVAEGDPYTELKIGDSPETADFKKYGGYVPLTLELIDRDDTRKLRLYPRELANAGLRRISSLVAAVFTANNGVGPTLADTGALFNTTAVTQAGGHANLRDAALSAAEWEEVSQAMFDQPMLISNEATLLGTGPMMAIEPRYLLVPRALRLTALKIRNGAWDATENMHSENLQRGEPGDVVVVPEWTDSKDWAAAADPRVAPGIIVGERFGLLPQVYLAGDELSPAVFTNDEHRLKVRHFVAVLVQDFRALHKSNVA